MDISLKHLALGFIAGAIAVVTVHDLIRYILYAMGLFPLAPWSMQPSAVTGVPQVLSDMFWGGLWGVLFVLLLGMIPGGSLPVQGLIYGIVAPAILGVFILVPLITGRFPLFFGGDPSSSFRCFLSLPAGAWHGLALRLSRRAKSRLPAVGRPRCRRVSLAFARSTD